MSIKFHQMIYLDHLVVAIKQIFLLYKMLLIELAHIKMWT